MKKKKNEYKPQRYKKVIRNIISVLGTAVLAYLFIAVGYGVAKPFGEIGEIEVKPIESISGPSDEESNADSQSSEQQLKAYWLKESDIDSMETLDGLINIIGPEYNMVVVPLKIEGGKLNYASSYEGAVLTETGNELAISDIYNAIKLKGYIPAASINTMHDNLYPNTSKNSGFLVKSTKKLWMDKQDDTGKPWLNPASTETKQYLTAITGEIATAGFEYIFCTDMEYPSFSDVALEDIGGIVTEKDRYLDLVDNVNSMNQIAEGKDSKLWLEISAYDLLTGNCEVYYKPIMLETQKYILKIDPTEFSGKVKVNGKEMDFGKMDYQEKIKKICVEVEDNIYKSSFVPEILSGSFNVLQKKELEKTFEELGYESYIFKIK